MPEDSMAIRVKIWPGFRWAYFWCFLRSNIIIIIKITNRRNQDFRARGGGEGGACLLPAWGYLPYHQDMGELSHTIRVWRGDPAALQLLHVSSQ